MSDKNGKHVPISSLTIPGTSNVYNQLHHHGPAFESDPVAYRIYFDKKKTVDIYGKFNKGFEIRESQFYPTEMCIRDRRCIGRDDRRCLVLSSFNRRFEK